MLEKLNPELPAKALDAAKEELTRDRSALSLVEGNREIDKLLCGGVKVTIPGRERGGHWTEVGFSGKRVFSRCGENHPFRENVALIFLSSGPSLTISVF